jgi:hypothetical protein
VLIEFAHRALPRVEPGRALAESEWRTLVYAADAILEGCPVPIRPDEVADNVERFLIAGRSKRAWRCRLLLTLVEYLPLAAGGARFSRMTKVERQALIQDRFMNQQPLLRGGRLWWICAKVRYLVLMGAYGDPRAAAATGFVPADQRPRLRVLRQEAS